MRNDLGEVCLVCEAKEGFYTFPGGHIENGESPLQALKRETHEETGAVIDAVKAICLCREIRTTEGVLQITHYYQSVLSKQEERHLTFEETERETQSRWFTPETCMDILVNQKKSLYHQKFSGYRDIEVFRMIQPFTSPQ